MHFLCSVSILVRLEWMFSVTASFFSRFAKIDKCQRLFCMILSDSLLYVLMIPKVWLIEKIYCTGDVWCFLVFLPHTNNTFFIVDYIAIPLTVTDQPIYLQNFLKYSKFTLNIKISQWTSTSKYRRQPDDVLHPEHTVGKLILVFFIKCINCYLYSVYMFHTILFDNIKNSKIPSHNLSSMGSMLHTEWLPAVHER